MLETLSVHPRICEQIRSGPLGRWVDDFIERDVEVDRVRRTGGGRRPTEKKHRKSSPASKP